MQMVIEKYYVIANIDKPTEFLTEDKTFTEQLGRTWHYPSYQEAQYQIDAYRENEADDGFDYMNSYKIAGSLMVVGVKTEIF